MASLILLLYYFFCDLSINVFRALVADLSPESAVVPSVGYTVNILSFS